MNTPFKTKEAGPSLACKNSTPAWLGRLTALIFSLLLASLAEAVPRRIIILRHGEKQDGYKLCDVGQQRSLALRAKYLGKDSAKSLFADGQGPAAFFAVTLHTLELASPAARSWDLPLQVYSVVPLSGLSKTEELLELNHRTQQAAEAVLTHSAYDGKTVVMVWEHDHIAKRKLEQQFSQQRVTLRQLLNMEALPGVPVNWSGSNYDYFWILDFDNPGSPVPTKFTAVKQQFPAPYRSVPHNSWGKPEKLPKGSNCEQPTPP